MCRAAAEVLGRARDSRLSAPEPPHPSYRAIVERLRRGYRYPAAS